MTAGPENSAEMTCPYLEKCPFFRHHQDTMPGLSQKLKADYCLRDNTRCARLWIREHLGKDAVPVLMMPHQRDWAEQLLSDAGKTKVIYHQTPSGK